LHFWLWFIGFNLTFFPMHIVGLQGMPRRIATYPEGMGWDGWNMIMTGGAFVIAISVVIFLFNVVVSRRKREEAGNDPWDARTLEWSVPSPTPEYNFAKVPLVQARDDWWHKKYVETPSGEPARVFAGGADEDEGHDVHLPSPSYFPLLAAFGLPILSYGTVFKSVPAMAVGGLIVVLGLFAWAFEPPFAEGEGHH
jgi:cytochrome c oxidase subunit 1